MVKIMLHEWAVTNIASASGIFQGENQHRGWIHHQKANQLLQITGDHTLYEANAQVLMEQDIWDNVVRTSKESNDE